MADTRTMAQLLQAPTEGYEDAILIPEIVANNFELRHGLIKIVPLKRRIFAMRSPDFSKGSMNRFMRLGIASMIYLGHVHTMDSQNCINLIHS
ncbi:hypothetical protein Tco_0372354, partial [Tanacetum coccineum]